MARFVPLFDIAPLFDHLATGGLVLTPNQRLASRIESAFAMTCRDRGHSVIETPAVFSLNNWLDNCWRALQQQASTLVRGKKRITALQEQHLWEAVVADSPLAQALLRPSATAKQAAAAYKLMQEWSLSVNDEHVREQFSREDDSRALLHWVDEFQAICAAKKFFAEADIAEIVKEAFTRGSLSTYGSIITLGFESIAPQYQALIAAAGKTTDYQPESAAAEVSVVQCDSFEQELNAAAVWAKQILKHQPEARVAVVIPELAANRHLVERIFLEVFEPSFRSPVTGIDDKEDFPRPFENQVGKRLNLPFNMSAGYPLNTAPVIEAALLALELGTGTITLEQLEALLQSPFVQLWSCVETAGVTPSNTSGPDASHNRVNTELTNIIDELDWCAALLSTLRNSRESSFTLSNIVFIAQKVLNGLASGDDNKKPFIIDRLLAFSTLLTPSERYRHCTFAHWVQQIKQLLNALGWPGARTLDSIEYQQVSQWLQCLEQIVQLDATSEAVDYMSALSHLRGLLKQQLFQAQSRDSSLQILGTLEAAGLQFSHIWLTSMSEANWPSSPSPNSLLPLSLQREQQMPHATAQRELDYARQLTKRFVHSTECLIASYPAVIDDNPVSISPLFQAYSCQLLDKLLGRSLDSLLPVAEIRKRHLASASAISYQYGLAPPLQDEETIYGGVSLFASQSACPFKAYARHRLGLEALGEPVQGLSAAERGSILHRALELLWQKLQNQQGLLQMSQSDEDALVEDCCQFALNAQSQKRLGNIGLRYQQLELARLKNLLRKWLDVERQRASFTVESVEAKKSFQFEQLKLETRIDRIDRLEDGRYLILDYKTANSSPARWWGDRPDEPQLPLYHLLEKQGGHDIAGVAFAEIRAEGAQIKGVGAEDASEVTIQWQHRFQNASGVAGWQQLESHWQKVLIHLAQSFIGGNADVDPKHPMQSCQYCEYTSLCRVSHKSVPTNSQERI